jgi:3-deoxy-manno-octulosonate cytidylyltransferase (CMP-KDO synthetase)|tara:strand:+ start:5931 stop:6668 length:738 start_codon:yes stop_codon:yes gene_type:complete
MANEFVIIVPARAGSSRLPNKPLAQIDGKSLLERVHELAQSSNATATYIATDNEAIRNHAHSIGAEVIMTSETHISGMDRIAEASRLIGLSPETHILNLQGDEPFMPLDIINTLTSHLSSLTPIATACVPLSNPEDIASPNEVKVVRSLSKRAMYFSRSVIPHEFTASHDGFLKHLGIYAYSNQTLQELTTLEPTDNELQERLEQLRFLDHGYNIFVEDYACVPPIGIDTPEDVERAIEFIKSHE